MQLAVFLILCPLVVFGHVVNRRHVYIYDDYGTDELHVTRMRLHLSELLPSYVVTSIGAGAVKEGHWKNNASLFVMPGGFDLGYIQFLGDQGAGEIRSYVRAGGAYLGQGAGSYYACDRIEFDLNGDDQVVGDRPLKFYPGMCSGPLFGPYSYHDYSSARAVTIHFRYLSPINGAEEGSVDIAAYYNGGNTFNLPMTSRNTTCESIGSFVGSNRTPAIVKCNTYDGKVVLSGVHLELGSTHLNARNQYLANVRQDTDRDNQEEDRIRVYRSILQQLGLDTGTVSVHTNE